ncbi:Guanyl-specific ribonuclease St [Streptomyces hundungensis]|uniref:Guanyl-specific ribonuclease St n=1 Tax=Streptomyces hundungensis TaxID=1077946 RepID=A0A387HR76_9ACTN|nr:ribonuclease domain-containing protein [Streptomyces hundungensis]AYG84082.1 Guanyl-specific ribonuclease St [Streptomyces hundungensis]
MITRFARIALAAVLACLAVLLVGCGGKDSARTAGPSASASVSTPAWAKGMATVPADRLPPEARHTLTLIDKGGPFPYSKDGVVFGNVEKLLPRQKRGYYHEYTVDTPNSRDRGARRLITGQGGEFYYTDDHYKTFKAVLR